MYNSGDIAGCERLYSKTYESLLRDPVVLSTPSLKSILELQQSKLVPAAASPAAHKQNAWALRHGFDAVLALLKSPLFLSSGLAAAAPIKPSPTPSPPRPSSLPTPSALGPSYLTASGTVPVLPPLLDCSVPEIVRQWYSLNDDVMGGISSGSFSFNSELSCGQFQGHVRTENSGGFSGVRCLLSASLQQYHGFVLQVLNVSSEAKAFEFLVQDKDAVSQGGINFRVPFTLPPIPDVKASDTSTVQQSASSVAKFTRVVIPFSAFEGRGTWRGQAVPQARLRWTAVVTVGLMILKPQVGPFRLLVRSVGVY
eukprot:gb/GEZN01010483.1/.p1 GENE.gb/GEZN01010483.1/~~gb/GEZN01010483.1/.p1  ORF type:complete len:356 (+),score=38.50 gb/GEZN01010483.1/:137-1069(+)